MSFVINDIADYLASLGRGTVGTSIFVGYMPPDTNGMAIIDTGGTIPDHDLPTKSPTFQVFVRSADYSTGKTLLDNVRSDLHQKANSTIGGNYYYYIFAISEGGHVGRDENGKDLFSMNFETKLR